MVVEKRNERMDKDETNIGKETFKRNKNNGHANNVTRVRRTRKHGSQCEGTKHGIKQQNKLQTK
jgi:hypothetical protein